MRVVGAVLEPMSIPAIDLMFGQKSVSDSPTAGPAMIGNRKNVTVTVLMGSIARRSFPSMPSCINLRIQPLPLGK